MTQTGREPSDLPYFTDDDKFIPRWLADDIRADYNFVTHEKSGEIYVYNDGIYEPRGKVVIEDEAQKRLKDFARQHHINETVKIIKFSTYEKPEKFDNPEHKIAVENGFLDPENRELEDFSPDKIHLTKINAKYDPEADCPKIKEFLSEILREEDIKTVQEMFGYCLFKDYPLAKAFMLLGSGANGKSTMLEILETFLGEENTTSPSLQRLLNNKFAANQLFGKLANIHADLSSNELKDTGKFKMLTGGDKLQAEKKYKEPFEFRNYAKLIYSANELPKTNDRTKAFFRRWIIIEFPCEFDEEDEGTDPSLPDCIIDEEELSGLLNWSLDGIERLLENKSFTKTDAREEIERKWMMQTDSLRAFIDMVCEVKQDAYISKEDLYRIYRNFCDKHNIFVSKKASVTKRIPTLEGQVSKYRPIINGERPRCWKNLTLKSEYFDKEYVEEVDLTYYDPDIHDKKEDGEDQKDEGQSVLSVERKTPIKNQIRDLLKEDELNTDEELMLDEISEKVDGFDHTEVDNCLKKWERVWKRIELEKGGIIYEYIG